MKLMRILGLLLCGAMAACGTGGSSPSDNSNNAGASGSGGNPDSPPDNGGGNGGDTNAGGGGGEAGSIGGEGGDPGVGGQLITSDVGVGGNPGGEGGFGGHIATGGSGGSPSSDCPESIDDMAPRDPCLVPGDWSKINGVGRVKVTMTQSGEMFTIHIEGENTFLNGWEFTGSTLPFERNDMEQGVRLYSAVDIDGEGHLMFISAFDGNPNGEEKYERD